MKETKKLKLFLSFAKMLRSSFSALIFGLASLVTAQNPSIVIVTPYT
jgi:hypothetical protein